MLTPRKSFLAALLLLVASLPACPGQDGKQGTQAADPESSGEPAGEVVAFLDGEPIRSAELEELVASTLNDLREQEYQVKTQAIRQIAVKRLLEKEAAERGITLDELFKAEVAGKVGTPTEERIQQYFDQNKNRDQNLRGKTLDQVRAYVQGGLQRQMLTARQNAYFSNVLGRADFRSLLEPLRYDVPLPAGEPSIGPVNAPVTVVEFADFQCGYCKRAQPSVAQLLETYGDRIHFVYRDYPLNFHKQAEPAAIAARCAGEQDKYWEYHGDLMTESGSLLEADLRQRAGRLGLDMGEFEACTTAQRHREAVLAGFNDGSELGVTGTPTFFVNGRKLVGAVSLETLKEVVEDELSRAAGGVSGASTP